MTPAIRTDSDDLRRLIADIAASPYCLVTSELRARIDAALAEPTPCPSVDEWQTCALDAGHTCDHRSHPVYEFATHVWTTEAEDPS